MSVIKRHAHTHTHTRIPTIYMTWLCVEVSRPAGVGLRLVTECEGEFVGQAQFGGVLLEY